MPTTTHSSSLGRLPLLGHLGWLRGALGALLGIGCAAGAGWLMLGHSGAWPWLVAPIGASAVLVFAVPASPLAQPWPVIGGDLISAAIGFALAHLLGPGPLACALAVSCAIAAMALARCLHPPGGACALLGPLGAGQALAWEGGFLLTLAVNLMLLVLVGWLYNGLTGHPWPHRPVAAPPPPPRAIYLREDLDAVLDQWDEVLDVDRDDLDALFQAVERQAQRRTGIGS
ncbi:MAG: HPP family protein [Croceibacterium sp.]